MTQLQEILENLCNKAIVTDKNLTKLEKMKRLLEINFEPIYIPSILGLKEDGREEFFQIYRTLENADESTIHKIIDNHKDLVDFNGRETRKLPDSTASNKKGLMYLTEFKLDYPYKANWDLLLLAVDHFYEAMTGLTDYNEAILGMTLCQSLLTVPLNHIIQWYAKAYALNPKSSIRLISIIGFTDILATIYTNYLKESSAVQY